MKHLKTYEEKVGFFTGVFLKYIVVETENYKRFGGLYLYEIDNNKYSSKLRAYYFENNVIEIDDDKWRKITDAIDFHDNILYQTDNYQDALEYIQIVEDKEKYNL